MPSAVHKAIERICTHIIDTQIHDIQGRPTLPFPVQNFISGLRRTGATRYNIAGENKEPDSSWCPSNCPLPSFLILSARSQSFEALEEEARLWLCRTWENKICGTVRMVIGIKTPPVDDKDRRAKLVVWRGSFKAAAMEFKLETIFDKVSQYISLLYSSILIFSAHYIGLSRSVW